MPHRLTNRARLAFAVAASIVPAAILAAALVGYDYYTRERTRLIRDTVGTARALVATVDGELAGAQAGLTGLASSPYLAAGDFSRFHVQASSTLKDLELLNVVLLDSSGRQRLNTLRPAGAALPDRGSPPALLDIVRTGRPAVADLFQGPVAKSQVVAVGVPVRVGGAIRYSLSAGIAPARLEQILTRQHLPEGWVTAVFDTSGTIVARTHQPERFVGAKGAPALVKRMLEVNEDALQTDTLEGVPVISVFSRSAKTRWAVAIGIPETELQRQLWFSMARLGIVAFLLMGTALLLALWIGARLWPGDPRAG